MISQITKDLMEKTGLNFDEFGQIRVIDSQLTTNSEDLKNLCSEFTDENNRQRKTIARSQETEEEKLTEKKTTDKGGRLQEVKKQKKEKLTEKKTTDKGGRLQEVKKQKKEKLTEKKTTDKGGRLQEVKKQKKEKLTEKKTTDKGGRLQSRNRRKKN
ncbi:nucleolar protein 58-like [Octopus sinensis]|uniref:Nucleolar protein 58-like n=1 Tax=Octopus sinensis TaxID=2607531 RepID=A0A6P7U4R9_9MOLL|nr:nucleolar protein 58-like [Octopus sinensis]